MFWLVKSFLRAVYFGFKSFEKSISNDIWKHRYDREMEKRKVF